MARIRPRWLCYSSNLIKNLKNNTKYGIITDVKQSRDGRIREIEIEYLNHNESIKRRTKRGIREIVVIHPRLNGSLSIYLLIFFEIKLYINTSFSFITLFFGIYQWCHGLINHVTN